MKVKSYLFKILLLQIIVFCYGCNYSNDINNGKTLDYTFYANYQNCIGIITQYHFGTTEVPPQYVFDALLCLEAITEIKHNMYMGDYFAYEKNEEDPNYFYLIDLKAWSSWYLDHKNEYDMKKALNAFEQFSKKANVHPKWPPFLLDIIATPEKYNN